MPSAPATVPLADFARQRGWTLRQVRHRIARGAPVVRGGSGRGRGHQVDVAAWQAWETSTPGRSLDEKRSRRDTVLEMIDVARQIANEVLRQAELSRYALTPIQAERVAGYVFGRIRIAFLAEAARDGLLPRKKT